MLNHFLKIDLRGFDLDCYQISQMDWGDSFSSLMQESNTKNGDLHRFFANMDVLQDPLSLDLDDLPTFGFIN